MADLDTRGLVPVGEHSNTYLNRRKLRSVEKNPMDKCTVVSILPAPVDEIKHTIENGRFHLDPGTYEKPATLIVSPSSWWKDFDVEQPLQEIPCGSIQIANAIVNDFCNGMLGFEPATSKPGLFFVTGEHKAVDIKMKYRDALEEAKTKQDNWFRYLINQADSLWARTNGNPLVIWDMMRVAARSLHEDSKPWLGAFEAPKLDKCKFCGGLRNPQFPICPTCKAIDQSHPLAKEIKFAV